MSKIPFLWTNDDLAAGSYEHGVRMLDFLTQWDLKGTFFVIPAWQAHDFRPLTDDAKLIELLKTAVQSGHEMHQHSVTHHCVENGVADIRMWELMPDYVKIDHSQNRFVLERLWEVDALEAHIGWGKQIWLDAFGTASAGYRPGCGSFCGNMYLALENLGFEWASTRMVSMTGWMRQAGHHDYPVRLEGPVKPYYQGKLMEFPILDDVAFLVPPERVDEYVELGWQLWLQCVENNHPFDLVSHPQGLAYQGGTGYEVHQKLLTRIFETGQAEPMTLGEYYARVKSGEFLLAPADTLYPSREEFPAWHAFGRK
jgi:peptidoglycan/xylan/chitin deacetylase (PgdA/CDA1 family)